MKKILFITIAVFVASFSFGQVEGFNYKALIANNGTVLSATPVTLRFTILQNGTTSVYQETQNATTDSNGIVTVNIGEGTTVSGNFSGISWGDNSYFLKVEINTGSGYQDFGTSEFKYVPYAKYAQKADVAEFVNHSFWQQNSNGINSPDRVGIGRPVSVEANLHINDVASGAPMIKMESNDNIYTIWQSGRAGVDTYLVGVDGGNNNFQISNTTTGAHPFTIKADKVGVNKINPTANLDVVGSIAIVDGTQAVDKVLTSDANGLASWQAIPNQTDADFYTVGSTTQPTSINDAIYHIGIMGLGTNNPNGDDILTVKNTSSDDSGHTAIHASMQGTGTGSHYGIYNTVGGSGTGAQFGVYTRINNSANGSHYGNYLELSSDGTGCHTGYFTRLSGNGNGLIYGSHILITNTGDGPHYGDYITLNGNNTNGRQYGSFVNISNSSGSGRQYAYYANLYGSSTGLRYGFISSLGGSASGTQYGVYADIDASGNGMHYGTYSYLSGSGTGAKFGTRNTIAASAGGDHYAVYGEATKNATNVYAGYFVGNVKVVGGKFFGQDSGNADMKAYVYGQIQTSATYATVVTGVSSSGFTVEKLAGTGKYRIRFNNSSLAGYIVTANRFYNPGFVTYRRDTGHFDIYVYDTSGSLIDSSFSFVVYKK